MNMRVLPSAWTVFVLLGVGGSLCRGTYQLVPSRLTPSENLDSIENERIIHASQVTERNGSKFKMHQFPREDRRDEGEGPAGEAEAADFPAAEKGKEAPEQERKGFDLSKFSRVIRSSFGDKELFKGKRLPQMLQSQRGTDYINRPGFRSWGGKRSKFSNWGGKRDPAAPRGEQPPPEEIDNLVDLMMMMKPFHLDYEDSLTRDERSGWMKKKDKFKSWGGKRSSGMTYPTSKTEYNVQTRFSNWKGKRMDAGGSAFGRSDADYRKWYQQDGVPGGELPGDDASKGELVAWRGKGGKQGGEHPPDPAAGKYQSSRGGRTFSDWTEKGFDSGVPVKREDDARAKQLLTRYLRYRRPFSAENSVLDVFRKKTLHGRGGLTKNGFSSWKGKR